MVKNLKNLGIAILIFAVLVTLSVGIHNGFKDSYDIEDNYTVDEKNVGQTLNDLGLIKALNQTSTAAYKVTAPTSNVIDVLGGLALTAIGTIQIVGGIATLPLEIVTVLVAFYTLPSIVTTFVGIVVTLVVGLIILSKFIGGGNETL